MTINLRGLGAAAILAIAFTGLTLSGCDNAVAGDTDEEKGVEVTGTVTLPESVDGKPWIVFIDSDKDPATGFVKSTSGTAAGSSFSYSISDVDEGTYYIYSVVHLSASSGGNPAAGDFVAMYGAASLTNIPSTANCVVPSSGSVKFDMNAIAMPDLDDGDDGDDGATVTGTVLVPEGMNGKPYALIVDTDENGGNGYAAYKNGVVEDGKIIYSAAGNDAGSYYIYAIVYASGAIGGAPAAGDYFGAYGMDSIDEWPSNTLKAYVTANGSNVFNFSVYLSPNFGGGGGDGNGGGGHTASEVYGVITALGNGRASAIANATVNSDGTANIPYNYTDANGYSVIGTLIQSGTFLNGPIAVSGGNITQIVFVNVPTDGSTITFLVTFSDGSVYNYVNGVLTESE
ncbi:hypothetical protein K7J14_14510 [Treponema zuelzerae]|uniref:Uncharacterized protein n=1 Tax=Teretinema zuelzerae TaxID=156 RepID=A0AAE3ELI7_9SPIR|nr:hypothetical protein [Teretinema zuelzerae]MCD1655908.1 hypothetical protein [Teretinema zuelzerae]